MIIPRAVTSVVSRLCLVGVLALSAFALFSAVGAPPAKALCNIDTNPDCYPIPDYYQLSVSKSGMGAGTVTGGGISCGTTCTKIYREGAAVTLTATPAAGWIFGGWAGCSSSTTSCTVRMYDDTHVTASFRGPRLRVYNGPSNGGSVARSVAGTGCGASCFEYAPGTHVSLTPVPAAPFVFDHWSGGCTGSGSCVVSMYGDASVTAVYALPDRWLSSSTTGDGTISGPGFVCAGFCSHQFAYGTTVTLTAAANAGSAFAGWSGCDRVGANNSCTVTLTVDRAVTAAFVRRFTLTIAPSPANGTVTGPGISCGADCGETFDDRTSVTLTPVAATGFRFTGWTGACSGTGACTVTMDADKTVGATFAPRLFTLSVGVSGGFGAVDATAPGEATLSCSLSCSKQYQAGTVVTLTPTPLADHTFGGFGGDCAGTLPCSLTIDADKFVTALFN